MIAMNTKIQIVSRATLQRLPRYHTLLKQYASAGSKTVSCTQLAAELKLDSSQVRKDIAVTGIIGRPKIGYDVETLIHTIRQFLGWNNVTDAILVGAGNMGVALMSFDGFAEYGLSIVAAFDSDRAKVGDQLAGKDILPMDKLPGLVRRLSIKIGIIAVPQESAQEVANLLTLSGIRAIWNFTPVSLDVPAGVIVENVRLSESLAVLSKRLAEIIEE